MNDKNVTMQHKIWQQSGTFDGEVEQLSLVAKKYQHITCWHYCTRCRSKTNARNLPHWLVRTAQSIECGFVVGGGVRGGWGWLMGVWGGGGGYAWDACGFGWSQNHVCPRHLRPKFHANTRSTRLPARPPPPGLVLYGLGAGYVMRDMLPGNYWCYTGCSTDKRHIHTLYNICPANCKQTQVIYPNFGC